MINYHNTDYRTENNWVWSKDQVTWETKGASRASDKAWRQKSHHLICAGRYGWEGLWFSGKKKLHARVTQDHKEYHDETIVSAYN